MSNNNQDFSWPGWETVGLIGRGSFGAVYEIQRTIFDDVEKAALKVISIPQNESDIDELYSDGYDDESITSTFQSHLKSIVAEYSLMRKMNGCTNIVNCDDVRYVQHDDGIGWDIFIKMELLTPLTKALPSDIPEETIVKIAKDMCAALELCKKLDIVHRDIKPQNIFVSDNGDYKLGDFGIAKTVERTMGGTKIGTYKYMAPEVYNNQPYGSGADIYSLGLVLYWLLNERRMPFLPLPPEKLKAGMDEKARNRRLSGEPLLPPAHGSAELKQIVLKACSYDPAARYATATEMLEALNACGTKQRVHVDGHASAVAPSAVSGNGSDAVASVGQEVTAPVEQQKPASTTEPQKVRMEGVIASPQTPNETAPTVLQQPQESEQERLAKERQAEQDRLRFEYEHRGSLKNIRTSNPTPVHANSKTAEQQAEEQRLAKERQAEQDRLRFEYENRGSLKNIRTTVPTIAHANGTAPAQQADIQRLARERQAEQDRLRFEYEAGKERLNADKESGKQNRKYAQKESPKKGVAWYTWLAAAAVLLLPLCVIFAGLNEPGQAMHIVTTPEVQTISDLRGKRVFFATFGTEGQECAFDILDACNMGLRDIDLRYGSTSQSIEALISGKAEAAIFLSTVPNRYLQNIAKEHELHFISLPQTAIDKLDDSYKKFSIPKGTYAGMETSLSTITITKGS